MLTVFDKIHKILRKEVFMNLYEKAMQKIRRDSKCKPACCYIVGATGPTGPTGPAGGPTGTTGPTGPTGATPNITIGTVTTGNPGSFAAASITGTTPNLVLNLTIPQGPTGPTGATRRLFKSSNQKTL